MPKTALLALIALSLAPVVSTAHPNAPYFQDCHLRTGRSASVVLPVGADLILVRSRRSWTRVAPGDEIAAFTPQGQCAGFMRWQGTSAVLSLWMDDPTTPQKDGYAPGDPLRMHVWDASSGDVFVGRRAAYHAAANTTGRFGLDQVYAPKWVVLVPAGTGARAADALAADALADRAADRAAAGPTAAATTGPAEAVLEAGYPNPFRTSARLRYGLPRAETVRLEVFDARGRRVTVLVDEARGAGWHEATLPADGLADGLYIVRLRAGAFEAVQRLTLVR